MSRASQNTVQRAWWLAEELVCDFCCTGYAVCTELRCVACDGAVCCHCVVIVREAEDAGAWCPACRRGASEEA